MERLANGATNATLWQAQASNAWGSIDTQRAGNGIQIRQLFDAQTGRIAEIDADPGNGSNAVLRHRYSYDAINNLAARIDDNGAGNGQAVSESFNYDAINRLIQYQVAGPAIAGLARTVTLHYNALGAMLDKTDVGVYRYPASGTESGLVHSVLATPANAADVSQTHELLHGAEADVFADAGYTGVDKREEITQPQTDGELRTDLTWHVAIKRGTLKQMVEGRYKELTTALERTKAQIRAKVEHPFHVVKNLFGHKKARNFNLTYMPHKAKAQPVGLGYVFAA